MQISSFYLLKVYLFRVDARKKLARTIRQCGSTSSVQDIEAFLSVHLSDGHFQGIATARNFFHVRNNLLPILATRLVYATEAEDTNDAI